MWKASSPGQVGSVQSWLCWCDSGEGGEGVIARLHCEVSEEHGSETARKRGRKGEREEGREGGRKRGRKGEREEGREGGRERGREGEGRGKERVPHIQKVPGIYM